MLDRAKNRGDLKPYLRNLNVRWFDFDLSDVQEMRFEPRELDRYSVKKGDLVICEGGYPGRAAVWEADESVCFQKALHRVRFREPVLAHWCLYYLFYEDATGLLRRHFNGAGIQHFTGEALSKFQIPVPPATEAARIVAILDEAFEGIATAKANAEKNLQNARELFGGYLEAALLRGDDGWIQAPIAECFRVKSGDFLPAKNMAVDGDIPVYGGNGVAGLHNVSNLSGDHIVIGRVGAKCGNVRHVVGDIWLTDNAFYISEYLRPFAPEFLAKVLSHKNLRQTANQAAQPVISYTTIKTELLSFPVDIDAQSRIAVRMHELEEQIELFCAVYTRKLAALDELKKSLLHQAFSGQL